MRKITQQPSITTNPYSLLPAYHAQQLKQLNQTFDILDEDHDGYITSKELIQLFSQIQVESDNNLSFKYLMRLLTMKQQRKQFREKQKQLKQKANIIRKQNGRGESQENGMLDYSLQIADGQFKISKDMFIKIILGQIGQLGQLNKVQQKSGQNKGKAKQQNTFITKQSLKPLFDYYTNGEKQIGTDKIAEIMKRLGQPYSQQLVQKWLKQYRVLRRSNKKQINFEDFYLLLTQQIS